MKNTLVALAACFSLASLADRGRPRARQGEPRRPPLRGRHRRALLLARRHRLAALRPVLEGAGRGLPGEPRRARASPSSRASSPGAHGSGMEQKSPVANPQGHVPWLDGDPSRPNPAYFEHVDHLVDFANRKGLVLAMLPTWGYYVKDVPTLNADERPCLRPLARRPVQGRAQRRLGERRRPHAHRLRGRLPRARARPARGGRRRPPHHLPPVRLALLGPVLPRRGLARLQHDRDLDRVGEDLPRRRRGRAPGAAKARRARRRGVRGRPRVPPGTDHAPPRPAPGLVDRDGRRLPHLRPEPDVAHGAGLGQDLRHSRRGPGRPDEDASSPGSRGRTSSQTRGSSRPASAASGP